MIYLIGGEARSGKTIVRKKLLNKYKIAGIGTDSIRYMLSHTMKDSGIDHNNPPQINGPLMWPFIDNLIKDLSIYAAEDYVIEGDILLPEYLKKYRNSSDIKACYIGFPSISISKEYSEKELRKFVKWGIRESRKYQIECKKYGITFYDLSEDFENGINEIVEHLVNTDK
jgi:hypothetical protein